MLKNPNGGAGIKPVLLIILLCMAVSIFSSAIPAGAHPMTAAAESLMVGGSDCSDFMNGAAVGMGIGVLFGCVWCGAGAILAKGISLFC